MSPWVVLGWILVGLVGFIAIVAVGVIVAALVSVIGESITTRRFNKKVKEEQWLSERTPD